MQFDRFIFDVGEAGGEQVALDLTNVVIAKRNSLVEAHGIAREQVAQLDAALVEQETGQRGFLLTDSEQFLEPYETGQREAARYARALREHSTSFSDLEDRLDRLEDAAARWRRGVGGFVRGPGGPPVRVHRGSVACSSARSSGVRDVPARSPRRAIS